jgi:tubulin polyglutamylase complex subunit 2
MNLTIEIIWQVCLVYLDRNETESDLKREDPKIWLLDRSFEWHFLAEDFTQYFRMMLVHQGLPQWQFKFIPMGLTPWAEVRLLLYLSVQGLEFSTFASVR